MPLNLLQVLPITQNIISDHFLQKYFSGQNFQKYDVSAGRVARIREGLWNIIGKAATSLRSSKGEVSKLKQVFKQR